MNIFSFLSMMMKLAMKLDCACLYRLIFALHFFNSVGCLMVLAD